MIANSRTEPLHEDLGRDFLQAMRQVASPVAVITTAAEGQPAGLTATAICSATTEPPTILVCVNRNVSAAPLLKVGGCLAVSFLSATQHQIARAFSTSGLPAADRFSQGDWFTAVTGAPLLQGSVSCFDCEISDLIPCGTHNIYVSRVLHASHTAAEPSLVYRDGFFRRLDENF